MPELYTYDATHLTIVEAGSVELTERAEHGDIGDGRFVLDDTAGTQSVVGQKDFSHTEADVETFGGFVGERTYEDAEAGRKISVALEDLNSMLGHRLIHQQSGMTSAEGGNRPAETVGARLTWLLASPFLAGLVSDNGFVDYVATKGMDAADYRYQHPGDVLADCALAAQGYNHFVYRDDATGEPSLWFADSNASADYTSILRISNDLADVDSVTTFAPSKGATLRRSPASVVSKLAYSYAKGTVVEERAATATTFNGERGGTASNSNVKTAAQARQQAAAQLWQLHTEEDIIECTVQLPAASVNDIRAGMRVEAKFTHLTPEGYASWMWFRVSERTVRPIVADAGLYQLDLVLSPQEEGPPAGAVVQVAVRSTGAGGGSATFPNPVTIGSLLVWMGCKRGSNSASNRPNPPNTNIAKDRWGAGAWTDATPALTLVEWDDKNAPPAYREGLKLYWKIADSTSASCYLDEYTASTCWELSGSTMTGATIVSKSLQALSNVHDVGSLGTPAAGQVALIMVGLGAGAAPAAVAINPGVWTRDLHADGFQHVWESDSNTVGFNQPASPETWLGHTITDGSALAATITDSYTHKWAGIAILVPAA